MRHSRGPGRPQPSTYGTAWHLDRAPGWVFPLGPPPDAGQMARTMAEQARRLGEEIRQRAKDDQD